MTVWFEVDEVVLNLAQELISSYHHELEDARIGFVFRDEAQNSGGKEVWAQASKVSDKHKVHLDFDFYIWIAHDVWKVMDPSKRLALLDHELCHCKYDNVDGSCKIRPHDFEEFTEIIERHGLWSYDLRKAESAFASVFQVKLPGMDEHKINVFALNPDEVPSG